MEMLENTIKALTQNIQQFQGQSQLNQNSQLQQAIELAVEVALHKIITTQQSQSNTQPTNTTASNPT